MSLSVYIVLYAVLLLGPLAVGWALGRRCCALTPSRVAAIWMILMVVWIACALTARWYGDSGQWGWSLAERFAHAGKWFAFAVIALAGFGYSAGASAEQSTHVVALLSVSVCAFITVWKTCPIYPFIQNVAMRGADGTLRQSTQTTCGPVALANAMEMAGTDAEQEKALARQCGTTCEGTTRWSVWRAALAGGFPNAICERMTLEELERTGSAAIVSIATMPGVNHATLYIGTFENVVILVDPQYGKCTMSRQRFNETLYGNPIVLTPRTLWVAGL